MVTISVAGSARHQHPAERGTLRLEARLEGTSRHDVVDAVAATHSRLTAEARDFETAGAATRWSAEQVRASSYVRYDNSPERGETVHVASASVRVRFCDFEALSTWITAVSAEPGITVDGVEWQLTDATRERAVRAVRIEAVQDAQARATAYAGALGLERVTAVRLSEPGTNLDLAAQDSGGMMRAAAFAKAAPALALTPEDITVSAVVTAEFEAA
ncbi:SIMPL domain-containing protein [Microbacteriaceae bacterium VKM Ac-2854]|nr:SIMPL domain-containing protein [Microbacteriaceae bacterium VKM Ac-2854]